MKTEIHKWSVAWICSFINFLYLGVPRLSGMFYLAAISRYNVNRNHAALPFVLCYTVRNISGPFIGCLSRKVKVETLILCGCLLSSVGVGVCFFAEDITTVSILWGGVFGLGFGLSTILIPSVLNQHFDKYISNANGIAFGGECIAGFVLPPLYDFCLNTFGPSGSFLILSGLLLHGIPAAMLLRPPDKKTTIAERNRKSIEIKWDSWLSIDKAGCSSENTHTNGRGKQVHEGLLHNKNEVKSLLDYSKNCYGTSNVAIAIQKKGGLRKLNESAPSSGSSKLDYKNISSAQYVALCNENSPNSKLSSCFSDKDVSFDSIDKRFQHENIENATRGEASGSVQDVTVNNEALQDFDSSSETTHARTDLSSDIISEKTPSVDSRNSEPSLRTKSISFDVASQNSEPSLHREPSVTYGLIPFCENIQKEESRVHEPNDTNQYSNCNKPLQNSGPSFDGRSSVSSDGLVLNERISKESEQLGDCNEASQNLELLDTRPSCEEIYEDSKVSEPKGCDQSEHSNVASHNLDTSLLKSPCVTTINHGVVQDSGGPSTESSLPNIPSQSNDSKSCCPPTVFLDPAFLLILLTQSSSIFVATTFTTILVDFSADAGVEASAAVYVLMCFSAADMAGRFGLGWVTDGAWLSGVAFSALCFGVMGAVLLLAPVAYQGFALVTGAVAVYGAVLGGLIVIGPVVVKEHVEKGAVNVALASRLALFAPMSLVQSSMIGYFRDTLGSYNGILYLLGLLCIVCSVLCLLIPSAAKCRRVQVRERDGTA